MKILFITSSSINGGAQKHIREMFKSLSALNNDVYLVAPVGWLTEELKEFGNKIILMESSISNIRRLSDILDDIHPDVTNTFILSGGCFGLVAWKKKKYGKIFVTVNNPVVYDGISKANKFLYPKLYRWMSKYVSAFLVKADKVRDEVDEIIYHKKPVISIKNGMDFSVFNKDREYADIRCSFGASSQDIVISNIAVLNERKGQIHLIDAVAALKNKYPVHLVLAGEGPYREVLEKRISELNAEKYIHLLGRRNDVNCILANSDIFVLSSYHEGLPNALMEAMAMAKPCIATNVGGVRQLIDNNELGIIINPKSSEEIYDSIEFIINNNTLAMEMGKKAYNKIHEQYEQKAVVFELLNLYKKY